MGEKQLANYSYEDYLDIDATTPQEERVELIFGEIFMMSGASRDHQDVVLSIAFQFKSIEKQNNCKAVIAPFDIKLECDGNINVVQPDVILFCQEDRVPCLVCEVLSPSTALKDKTLKKELYECFGVLNYLIVDPLNHYVDKYTLQDNKLHYDKCYGKEDTIFLECLDESFDVGVFFE
jgi:Uma2 family endonuclease